MNDQILYMSHNSQWRTHSHLHFGTSVRNTVSIHQTSNFLGVRMSAQEQNGGSAADSLTATKVAGAFQATTAKAACCHVQEERADKLQLVAIYNERLTEREYRRAVIIDRGLLNVKRFQVPSFSLPCTAAHTILTCLISAIPWQRTCDCKRVKAASKSCKYRSGSRMQYDCCRGLACPLAACVLGGAL